LQRFLVGGALIYYAILSLTEPSQFEVAVPVLLGALIIAGLWTPVTGVIISVVEGWIAFCQPNSGFMPIVLAVLGLSLAMIGPGAWSVDARLFGRKQINADL
jgi:putative oxidoreductase